MRNILSLFIRLLVKRQHLTYLPIWIPGQSSVLYRLALAIGSGLAGIAGCSVALLGSIDSTVGQSYIVNSFMAVVLGGVFP